MRLKNVFTFFLAAKLLAACTPGTKYTIKGSSKDFADGKKVYLVRLVDDKPLLDSTVVVNNSFTLKGEVAAPCWAKLAVVDSSLFSRGNITMEIILEPGNIIVGDYDEARVGVRCATGTPLNDAMMRFFIEAKTIKDNTALSREEGMSQLFFLVSACVKENADNELGAFIFERYDRLLPNETKLELADVLSADNPTLYADLRRETLEDIEDEKRAKEQAASVQPGNSYKNVSGRTADGSELNLSDVVNKNKFVLLEFWATWCGPCMDEVPFLIDTHKKFNDKGFEIFAVSLADDNDDWVSTVKEKRMQWVNVRREGKEATDKYGVRGIPSNYLIDCSTGKIVAVHLRGNSLAEKLTELLD